MNFFEGKIENGNFACRDFKLKPSGRYSELLKGSEGREVVLGVRPENVVAVDGQVSGDLSDRELADIEGGGVNVSINLNENLGQTTLIHGSTGSSKIVCKFREWCNFEKGDTVKVSFDRIHFFDKETTKAIR